MAAGKAELFFFFFHILPLLRPAAAEQDITIRTMKRPKDDGRKKTLAEKAWLLNEKIPETGYLVPLSGGTEEGANGSTPKGQEEPTDSLVPAQSRKTFFHATEDFELSCTPLCRRPVPLITSFSGRFSLSVSCVRSHTHRPQYRRSASGSTGRSPNQF